MDPHFERIMRLARNTGGTFIVHDEESGEDLVVMSLDEYEYLVYGPQMLFSEEELDPCGCPAHEDDLIDEAMDRATDLMDRAEPYEYAQMPTAEEVPPLASAPDMDTAGVQDSQPASFPETSPAAWETAASVIREQYADDPAPKSKPEGLSEDYDIAIEPLPHEHDYAALQNGLAWEEGQKPAEIPVLTDDEPVFLVEPEA